jgi:hypothetical protein
MGSGEPFDYFRLTSGRSTSAWELSSAFRFRCIDAVAALSASGHTTDEKQRSYWEPEEL